ncbi:hypothetical protein [Clostridium sp.]|uniref:hypothetical protein n=1 Tax=Clostridium sp. TaxID=1506 RepID=UPI003D6C9AD1
MGKYRFKKTLSIALIAALITTLLPYTAFADGPGDNDNGGGGSGGSNGSVGGSSYTQLQSGYRMSIVNEQFKQVSNTVDILFKQQLTLKIVFI